MSYLVKFLLRFPIPVVQSILILLTLASSFGTSLGEAYFPYTGLAIGSLISLVVSTVVYYYIINVNVALPVDVQFPLIVLVLIWTVGNGILTYLIYMRMFALHGIQLPVLTQIKIGGCFFIVVVLIYYVKVLIDPFVAQLPVVH